MRETIHWCQIFLFIPDEFFASFPWLVLVCVGRLSPGVLIQALPKYCLLPVAETLPAAHKWPAHSALTVTPAPSSPCTDPCLRAGRPVIGMLGRVGHGHRKKLKKICSLWAALDMDIALRCEKFDIRIRGTALWVVKAFLLASVSPNNALGWSWVTSLFSGFSFGLQQDVFGKNFR